MMQIYRDETVACMDPNDEHRHPEEDRFVACVVTGHGENGIYFASQAYPGLCACISPVSWCTLFNGTVHPDVGTRFYLPDEDLEAPTSDIEIL